MTTMTGPARLRQIAEFTILSAAELRQLAAQWEADLERAALDQAERDAARADVARLTPERAAMLNVKTTEGLTASEWLARTAKAEAEVARLTALLFRAVNFITQHADADEVCDAVDALRQPAPAGGEARP